MANKFSFSDCFQAQPAVNYEFQGCCETITCSVQNIHDTALNVNNLSPMFGAGYFDVTLISINGTTPSFPFLVPHLGSFTMEIQICHIVGSLTDVLTIQIDTVEHAAENYNFNFDSVFLSSNISTTTFNFGIVEQYTASAPMPLTVTNPTFSDLYFDLNFGTCPNEFTYTAPMPILVLAGTSETVDVIWMPTGPAQLIDGCDLEITPSGDPEGICEGFKFSIKGESTPALCDCLCLNSMTLSTESNLLDDIVVNEIDLYSLNSICENKTLTYSLHSINPILTGFQLFFNPWLFSFVCDFGSKYAGGIVNGPPSTGYFIEYNSSIMGTGSVPMNLIGTGANQFNQQNFNITFKKISSNDFAVSLEFYFIEDLDNWITSSTVANNPKWRRNSVNAPNPPISGAYSNAIASIYNTNRKLCSLFYSIDPNHFIPETTDPIVCMLTPSINLTARWFNRGLYDTFPAEFTGHSAPQPTFELSRTIGPVTTFSTVEKTLVVFKVNIDSSIYSGMEGTIFQIFDETQTNNGVDFLTNYNSSRSIIPNIAPVSVLDNNLETPSTFYNSGTDDWYVTAHVNTAVLPSGKYRIAAIVYSKNEMVNTFISDQISVVTTPEYSCEGCIVTVGSTFSNFFQAFNSTCIQPTGKERINHFTEISALRFSGCIEGWGGDPAEWWKYMSRITLNVYRAVADFPSVGQTTFFRFSQHVSNRVAGFPAGWQNLGDMIVADVAGTVTTDYLTRVRWEPTPFNGSDVFVANTATFMNRVPAGALGSTYVSTLGIQNDWRGELIWYEYTYRFDLTSLFGTPYFVDQVHGFQMLPIPNEPNIFPIDSHLDHMLIEGYDATLTAWVPLTNPICPTDYEAIRISYYSDVQGLFIFFAEPLSGGTPANLSESEDPLFPSVTGMPILNSSISISQGFFFWDGSFWVAFVQLDMSLFPNGQYNLCGYINLTP